MFFTPQNSQQASILQKNCLSHEEAQNQPKHKNLSYQGKSLASILVKNIFNLFNLLNFSLALLVLFLVAHNIKYIVNLSFMGLVISNTLLSIFQELKAQKTLQNLKILHQSHVKILRKEQDRFILLETKEEEIALGDVLLLESGMQIKVDGVLIFSQACTLDEALLTGESDAIEKKEGDCVYSGTFVLSGKAWMKVNALSEQTFAQKITQTAQKETAPKSQIMLAINFIVQTLSLALLPVGSLLFLTSFFKQNIPLIPLAIEKIAPILLSVVAALVGMIPEGLVLLCSIAFAVSITKLGTKFHTLVQSLPSVEALARVDVLCLDKTGTLTSGKMKVREFLPLKDDFVLNKENIFLQLLHLHFSSQSDNLTQKALKHFLEPLQISSSSDIEILESFSFSSEKKYASTLFSVKETKLQLFLGAPEYLLNEEKQKKFFPLYEAALQKGLRVLLLQAKTAVLSPTEQTEELGFFFLEDELRPHAEHMLHYFRSQDVKPVFISGDHPHTVLSLIKQQNFFSQEEKNTLTCVDMQNYATEEKDLATEENKQIFRALIAQHTVFGRVSPLQKKALVQAFQETGHTVAMTGDGINDVPALKKADCAIAMAEGADIARGSADFVLLNNDLASLLPALHEGRRVIHNLERVAVLFLSKTIYSCLLAFIFIFLPWRFPLLPVHLTLISNLTIGIPAFFLALKNQSTRVKGNFLDKVLRNSLPYGLGISGIVLIHHFFIYLLQKGNIFTVSPLFISEASLLIIASGAFSLLFFLAKPFDFAKTTLLLACLTCFVVLFFGFSSLLFLWEMPNFLQSQIFALVQGSITPEALAKLGYLLFILSILPLFTFFKIKKEKLS